MHVEILTFGIIFFQRLANKNQIEESDEIQDTEEDTKIIVRKQNIYE